jgi:putative ABC transport system permease protein
VRVLVGWLRVALIDLRGDLRRFTILLACLALGVGTITVVSSVSAAMQAALLDNARVLLGGDIEAQLSYRRADPAERQLFDSLGRTAEVVEVLGRGATADDSAFLSLRAVDGNYPLIGTLDIGESDGGSLAQLVAERDGLPGAVVDPLLLDRLHLAIGDTVRIGKADFAIRGTILSMPDSLSSSMQVGINVFVSLDGIERTGILGPGVLARYRYKIALDGVDFADAASRIREAFPQAGWQIRAPRDATDELARFFDIFGRFLVIVGLSSLLVGGVGVSNAVSAYITERQRSIATLKALGASGARILVHFLVQIGLLAALGILIGLVLGTALALLLLPLLGQMIGLGLPAFIDDGSLAIAAGFGALIAFAFSFAPLRRAQKLRPALLFRSAGMAVEGGLGWRDLVAPLFWLPLLCAALGLFGLAVVATGRPEVVSWYAIGAVVSFIVLRLAGLGLQALLRALPPAPHALLRNAIKAIHHPGAPAPVVILSLGMGLALLLLIALIDGNLRHQLKQESIPNAPSFVFMDLFDDEVQSLKDWAGGRPEVESFEPMPMLRGTLSAINGEPMADRKASVAPEYQSLGEDESPLTFATELPEQSSLMEGTWWGKDYDGPGLVSITDRLRTGLGLKLGDELTFQVMGSEVSAKVASVRDFGWRNGAVTFGFVFSPSTFADLPVSYIGLLKVTSGRERPVQQDLVAQFPSLVFLPVSEAVESFGIVLGSVIGAVEAIGALAVLSGGLVLAGAMIAGRRQREADAVVMKVLGATRGDVVRAYVIEYGLLGLLSAVLASLLGLVGTWAFVTYVLQLELYIDPTIIVVVTVATVVLTIALGTLVTWSALSVRPARFLREE